MIPFAGHLVIVLALALAVCGCAGSFAALPLHSPALARFGRYAALGVFLLVASATGLMLFALVSHDFSVKYVADVGSRETPLYYTIVSLWGALEGSILFWAFLLSLYTAAFLLIYRRRYLDLQPAVTGVLLAVSTFFLFVIAGPGNPFVRVSPAPTDGPGPNPLLQNHWMMGVHPVLLYLGYVGLAVPFAVAMATILTRAPGATTLPLIRRWALVPWAFLSLGIVAGMWWSYAVLGWGGYWSWDPVENASLMPWLITTAFLHSLQVQERRRMLQVWTLSLIVGAFQLSILGTFLTRSGVLASVHSFTQSGIGPLFLGFLVVSLTASLGLVLARSRELSATGRLDALICRESVFLFNNLLLVAVTFTVLFGTLFPLLAEAVQGAQLSVGAPYFDRIVVPLGVGLLLLMGIGPALPWGAARLEELQWRLLVPVACGVALVVLLVLIGVRGPGTLNVFGVIAFVAAVTIARVRGDMQARRRSTGETWMEGTGHLLRANPRRYAGYLVHLGVLLLVAGIAASQAYQVRGYVTLHYGQAATVDGYRLVDSGLRPRKEPNRMVMGAAVAATRGGESLGILVPSQNFYATMQQPIVTPGVREEPSDILIGLLTGRSPLPDLAQLTQGRNPFEDLYLVLESVNGVNANHFNARAGSITLLVLVNPMVGFIWLGGFTMGLGGFLAVLPARKRRRVVVTAPVRVEPEGVEVPA